jgi:hypothetical protein
MVGAALLQTRDVEEVIYYIDEHKR